MESLDPMLKPLHLRGESPGARRALPRGAFLALAVALLGVAAVLSGCGSVDKQSTFETFGPVSKLQLDVFYVTLWVSLGIFAVVGSLLVFTVFRFRVPGGEIPDDAPLPPQTHGNAALEVGLTLASVLLLVIIAVPTVRGIFVTSAMPETADTITINAIGYQWWWAFEYPNRNLRTANELVIPVGHPIVINLKSADVIHSFWVPKLAGKVDLIPNQHNQLWLRADRTGIYYGQCAEFCGESHANMRFRVRAVYDADYQSWLASEGKPADTPTDAQALAGMKIFTSGPREGNACASCHTVRGVRGAVGLVGPDLTHFANRGTMAAGILPRSDDSIRQWLTDLNYTKPGNKMLAAHLQLTQDEVAKLTAFLDSLR